MFVGRWRTTTERLENKKTAMEFSEEDGRISGQMVRAFVLVTFFWAVVSSFAADPEAEAYTGAAEAFRDKFYERAEQQFAEFIAKYPKSTNVAPAMLFEAEAQISQKKYDGALALLKANFNRAGELKDKYLFREAEALSGKGETAVA